MKPVEDMTLEEIQAERAAIAAERAKLNGKPLPEAGYVTPGPEVYDAVPALEFDPFADPDLDADEDDDEDDDAPESWPHEHLTYEGLELDVRTPNQSALMAISMLQQLDGHGDLQMEIFNSFLANHLSPSSLAAVIKEMTRPDSEMSMQGLVQALVNLRINAE